jgi:hypothetical protein
MDSLRLLAVCDLLRENWLEAYRAALHDLDS